jgi:proline/betaine transport protein TphA
MQNIKKTIFAGIFGNALEFYDFSVYAFFAPLLADFFFPNKDPLVSLLLTLSVFAVSFLVRPIGGIFFGYLGDHFGRKKALITTIVLMSGSTCLLGLLPGYASIGIGAPILLVLCRLAQGIAVSGELTTAMSYLVEHAHHQRRGFIGSLAMCSGIGGTALGSAVAALVTAMLGQEQLLSWGWRVPFLLGGLLGLFGLYLRLSSEETSHFLHAKEAKQTTEKPSLFNHYRKLDYRPIVFAVLVTCIMAIGNYFVIGYFSVFLIKTLGHPANIVTLMNFISLLVFTLLLPVFGWLSDRIGRKPVLMLGMIGLSLVIHPIFWLLQQQSTPLMYLGMLLFVCFQAPIASTIPTTLAEMFPVHTRNSSISLGYNLSLALFGGTAPLVAVQLTASSHNFYAPAWYLIVGAGISLLTLWKITESYQRPLA